MRERDRSKRSPTLYEYGSEEEEDQRLCEEEEESKGLCEEEEEETATERESSGRESHAFFFKNYPGVLRPFHIKCWVHQQKCWVHLAALPTFLSLVMG